MQFLVDGDDVFGAEGKELTGEREIARSEIVDGLPSDEFGNDFRLCVRQLPVHRDRP